MLGDSCGVTIEIHPAPDDMGRAFRHFVLMELCGRLRGHHDVADELEETQVSVIPTGMSL
jgi:FAD/FMN-containing dehydrogenase